jgi:hypothetical protein
MTIEDTMNTRACGRACARCGTPLEAPVRSGRPRRWCSQRCRRAAYEDRRAAATGAVAVRVVELEHAVEKPPAKATVDEAIQIVLGSQRAWRAVLDELTRRARAGAFDRWGGDECERNSLAAHRFTSAVVAYMRARVDEELRRQRRSWAERWYGPGPGLADGRPRDRDDLG